MRLPDFFTPNHRIWQTGMGVGTRGGERRQGSPRSCQGPRRWDSKRPSKPLPLSLVSCWQGPGVVCGKHATFSNGWVVECGACHTSQPKLLEYVWKRVTHFANASCCWNVAVLALSPPHTTRRNHPPCWCGGPHLRSLIHPFGFFYSILYSLRQCDNDSGGEQYKFRSLGRFH